MAYRNWQAVLAWGARDDPAAAEAAPPPCCPERRFSPHPMGRGGDLARTTSPTRSSGGLGGLGRAPLWPRWRPRASCASVRRGGEPRPFHREPAVSVDDKVVGAAGAAWVPPGKSPRPPFFRNGTPPLRTVAAGTELGAPPGGTPPAWDSFAPPPSACPAGSSTRLGPRCALCPYPCAHRGRCSSMITADPTPWSGARVVFVPTTFPRRGTTVDDARPRGRAAAAPPIVPALVTLPSDRGGGPHRRCGGTLPWGWFGAPRRPR